MGVPSISALELHHNAASPVARTPSSGAPETAPPEATPSASATASVAPRRPEPAELSSAAGVRLHVDEATNRIIAQVVDENDNVVRQIPPEDALRIAERSRQLFGLLFDQSV